MAKKTTINKNLEEIRNALKKNELIIGTDRTIKMLKLGKTAKVFVTSNCSEQIITDLEHYTKLSKAELVHIDYPNKELGVFCKKQYSISVVSIPKGA
tara:strand:+ start:191 stop:481 length:291 start_codon:yes stop_codon:yes gene_type:complete